MESVLVFIVLIIVSFLPLAVCRAQGQSESFSPDLVQRLCFDGSNPNDGQCHKMRTRTLLPDARSIPPPTQGEKFQVFVDDARSPLTLSLVVINATVMHAAEQERLRAGKQAGLAALYGSAALEKESSSFFGKYLYSSLLRQDPRYQRSTSDSIAGRGLYAASRVFITRKDSGKKTLNTSYFLGLLTSRIVATAYRPYWARSNSIPFKTFGSTIGSDMGIDILHEFGPGIRQLLKRHLPKFLRSH